MDRGAVHPEAYIKRARLVKLFICRKERWVCMLYHVSYPPGFQGPTHHVDF